MNEIKTLGDFDNMVSEKKVFIAYFSHEKCNVCHVLLPKVQELIQSHFPKASLFYCNTVTSPEIAAQNRVFTVPTVKIFIDGKEHQSFSRNMGISQLQKAIERPYNMIFEEFK